MMRTVSAISSEKLINLSDDRSLVSEEEALFSRLFVEEKVPDYYSDFWFFLFFKYVENDVASQNFYTLKPK